MTDFFSDECREVRILPLFGAGLSVVLASFGTSTVAVTLPALSEAFASIGLDVTLAVSIYIVATAALVVPMGRLGDLLGHRDVLAAGLCLYAIGAFLAASAPGFLALLLGRLCQGMGAAAMMVVPLAVLRNLVPSGQIGRWVGLMGSMSAIGTASGPALSAVIMATLGWRMVFLFQLSLALVALGICLISLSKQKQRTWAGVNLLGSVALAIALVALSLLVTQSADGAGEGLLPLLFFVLLSFAAFILVERRSRSPIIPLHLLRSVRLRLCLAMNAAIALIMMGLLVVGPFYLLEGLGLDVPEMGLVMSVGPVASVISGLPAGRLVDKVGGGQAMTIGAMGMVLANAAMAALPYILGMAGFVMAFLILAPSYQVLLASVNATVLKTALEEDRGVTSGVLSLSRNAEFILGASAIPLVFRHWPDFGSSGIDSAQQVKFAMVGTYTVCCGISFLVLGLAIRLRRKMT